MSASSHFDKKRKFVLGAGVTMGESERGHEWMKSKRIVIFGPGNSVYFAVFFFVAGMARPGPTTKILVLPLPFPLRQAPGGAQVLLFVALWHVVEVFGVG